MTGTDRTQIETPQDNGPVVILVGAQMGENIGAAARAMMNCGITRMRLVAPRDGWPNPAAEAMSSGALELMPPVEVFATTAEALADIHHVYATTARPRDMVKHVLTARGAAEDMHTRIKAGEKTAILFGAERSGLANDDVALAQSIITIPLNPGFSSLNLGQAVLLVCHEFMSAGDATPPKQLPTGDSAPATHEALVNLYERLEDALDDAGFFRSPEMKPSIVRNLRNMLGRAAMTEQEVRTFHGMISVLAGRRTGHD